MDRKEELEQKIVELEGRTLFVDLTEQEQILLKGYNEELNWIKIKEEKMGKTGTSTITLENGERVYPCRCGKTHRGDYAGYDFGHHNCLHEEVLLGLPVDKNTIQAICPQCGMSWKVDMEAKDD